MPTVSNCISELVNNNLIVYNGRASSTGGRKAQYIEINKNHRTAIGVSITKVHLRFIALNLTGEIIAFSKIKNKFSDAKSLSIFLSEKLENFLNDKGIQRSTLLGVGIAVPGLVSIDKEIIEVSPTLGFKNIKSSEISKFIPYETVIINDASCGGAAELWQSPNESNLIYLSVDRGVGGAIYFNKTKLEGEKNHSAEFGHMCIVPNGKICECGKRGCFEAYCSTNVLSVNCGYNLEEFFDEVANGNTEYKKILDEYISYLAIGISNINMVFDQKIILGGSLSAFVKYFITLLDKEIQKNNIINTNKIYQVSKNGSNSTSIGAALNFISNFIDTI